MSALLYPAREVPALERAVLPPRLALPLLQSFPLTEEEYELQLEAVAEYLNLWQAQDTVRAGIRSANKRGPGYTGGGNARAISIPLGGQRGCAWLPTSVLICARRGGRPWLPLLACRRGRWRQWAHRRVELLLMALPHCPPGSHCGIAEASAPV